MSPKFYEFSFLLFAVNEPISNQLRQIQLEILPDEVCSVVFE